MKLTESQALADENGKLISGKWELNKKHQLVYRTSGRTKETLTVTGTILDIGPAGLTAEITQKRHESKKTGRIIRLKGQWRLDAGNRIRFEIDRTQSSSDTLRFKNTWTVNRHHEVVYTYLEEQLKTKRNITRTLTFKGHWDIGEKNQLTYYLQRNDRSYFRVRGAFQTGSLQAKKGEIRYQFGIEVERRVRAQKIVLFGKWKYSKKYGLHFEMQYRDGRRKQIRFGGLYNFNSRSRVEVNLLSVSGAKLGTELILTRAFLKTGGEAFVRLFRSEAERGIEGGVNFRW